MTTRSSSRREEILRAALECFAQHGVEATTIEMIREASGASVGSLYHHFGSKERIAAGVYLEGLRNFRVIQQDYLDRAEGLEAGIKALVYANVDWIVANPEWARFVFNYRAVLAEAGGEAQYQEELKAGQMQVLAWFKKMVGPDARLPWPPEVAASLIVGPVHDYARHWLAGRCKVALAELREVFAEAAWRAVGLNAASAPGA